MNHHLREDLFAIWEAGVSGVAPGRLVRENVFLQREGNRTLLCVQDRELPADEIERIVIIGAGKASAQMGIALERELLPFFGRNRLQGWINVPEDCREATECVHLHGARPAGINEPTREGVHGTREMLALLDSLGPRDLCFCLLSGGGSALMPAPPSPISLESKVRLTRFLSLSGADITELNTVRKQLSLVKGGGLRRLCRGKNLITLILSDVLGDPLDVIASGPTVENETTATDALRVLEKYGKIRGEIQTGFSDVWDFLTRKANSRSSAENEAVNDDPAIAWNFVLGNNALAVDCAGIEAEKRGYSHAMVSAKSGEGPVELLGNHFFTLITSMLEGGPDCLISGGEPTVALPDLAHCGKGGRNQQLILHILVRLIRESERFGDSLFPLRFAFLSGGTDGEDGPTDAAGAFLDETVFRNVLRKMRTENSFDPEDFLRRCDAYPFFEQVGGLLKTGPTGTNVCDLRVLVVQR